MNLNNKRLPAPPVKDQNERAVVVVVPHFDNLTSHLKRYIKDATSVVGCVAWLTHYEVLAQLAEKPCGIVVQKELYLRTDVKRSSPKLRAAYDSLRPLPNATDAVRCCGLGRSRQGIARMHHKFFVFLDDQDKPYAVWTGSFNVSQTATLSLENAVYVADPVVAAQYYHEWKYVLSLSESLDWGKQPKRKRK